MWQKLGEISELKQQWWKNIKGQVVLVAFPAQQIQWCIECTTPIIVVKNTSKLQMIWYKQFVNQIKLKIH